eukprot:PhF_6_TR29265/c0_g1_i2/m.42866
MITVTTTTITGALRVDTTTTTIITTALPPHTQVLRLFTNHPNMKRVHDHPDTVVDTTTIRIIIIMTIIVIIILLNKTVNTTSTLIKRLRQLQLSLFKRNDENDDNCKKNILY